MASHQVSTLELASLEKLQSQLIEAEFEPLPGDLSEWRGPLVECLTQFTSASTMTIKFVDGWPFQHPRLYVQGMNEPHSNPAGDVCLWPSGAVSDQWLTFEGYVARIEEWARRTAEDDFGPEDFALDAHLAFAHTHPDAIATVNLGSLRLPDAPRGITVISGRWSMGKRVMEIVGGSDNPIVGRAYWVKGVRAAPRDIETIRDLLSTEQRHNFERRYHSVAESGEPRLFLISWEREDEQEALVVLAENRDGVVAAEAIEVAPIDTEYLMLRAGDDARLLSEKRVIIFGIGAIGSNLAFRLAESGVGKLTLVDSDTLRPGNVVRHAASRRLVGAPKVGAVHLELENRTPWTVVKTIEGNTWNPDEIRKAIEDHDCVVDATGLASFTIQLSILGERTGIPLVSSALYYGGSLTRIRRQADPADVSIAKRSPDTGHLALPPRETECFAHEPGCSAPVNNASPVSVAAAAARTAFVVIDYLTGAMTYGDEVIEVLRPLDIARFDRVGIIRP